MYDGDNIKILHLERMYFVFLFRLADLNPLFFFVSLSKEDWVT